MILKAEQLAAVRLFVFHGICSGAAVLRVSAEFFSRVQKTFKISLTNAAFGCIIKRVMPFGLAPISEKE